MNFFNLKTSQLRTPEFRESSAAGRGTWLVLVTHCVEQENGGRIQDCRRWKNRLWLEICGVELAEVEECTSLLQWEGNDLVVMFYPLEMENSMRERRENGRSGGLKSAEMRRVAKDVDSPGAEAGDRNSSRPVPVIPEPSIAASSGGQGGLQAPVGGKLKEGCNEKEVKENGNGKVTEDEQASPTGSLIPEREPVDPPSSDDPTTVAEEWLAGFDEFWQGYPRKDAKARALKAWQGVKGKRRPRLVDLLTALAHQAASDRWREDDGRFIPHAATWIHGRRWEDAGVSESMATVGVVLGTAPPEEQAPLRSADPDGLSPMQRQWAETKRLARAAEVEAQEAYA